MKDADAPADLPTLPDPPKDRRGKPVPNNISCMLCLLDVLLEFGNHLRDTLQHRATARSFSVIGQLFGTARLPAILARLSRGILRCMALQRVLFARAARGRDLVYLKPYERKPRPPQTDAAQTDAAQTDAAQNTEQQAERQRRPPRALRPCDPRDKPDLASLPTLEQMEAEIRGLPTGRVIADICNDLGIRPSICDHAMWDAVFSALCWYRGNLNQMMRAFDRRAVEYARETDHNFDLDRPPRTRDDTHRMLGFFVGMEHAVLPAALAMPAAVSAMSAAMPATLADMPAGLSTSTPAGMPAALAAVGTGPP